MALQRRMVSADPVQLGDFGDDIARRVVIADPDLVFFGIQIFLAARQRGRFAKLKARIHAPQAGQRRGQRGANEKAGPAGGLQKIRIDIRRVDEKMRAEIVLHLVVVSSTKYSVSSCLVLRQVK